MVKVGAYRAGMAEAVLGEIDLLRPQGRKVRAGSQARQGFRFSPKGEMIDEATWTKMHTHWLPTQADRDYVQSCMVKVTTPGKFANYIAPPQQGVNDQPIEFEYVKFH